MTTTTTKPTTIRARLALAALALGTLVTGAVITTTATASATTAPAAGTASAAQHQPANAAALAPMGVAEVINGTVRGTNVNLRTMPTIPSGIRGKFSSPMNLGVQCWAPYAYGNHWYRVKIGGWGAPTGYMAAQYVNFSGSVPKCAGF
jgi:hypothetical protein